MQRGETRRKRKNKRLGRLQQVSPSVSQLTSPTNSGSPEEGSVRSAQPFKQNVVRQHAAIPEDDDEILEELTNAQLASTWSYQKPDHSPVSDRRHSAESYDRNQRRQSIRSQDLSDAPSTIHSVHGEEDHRSRHVRFRSPQVSARSELSMRRPSTNLSDSQEDGSRFMAGAKSSHFPSLTERERFFEEINERRNSPSY